MYRWLQWCICRQGNRRFDSREVHQRRQATIIISPICRIWVSVKSGTGPERRWTFPEYPHNTPKTPKIPLSTFLEFSYFFRFKFSKTPSTWIQTNFWTDYTCTDPLFFHMGAVQVFWRANSAANCNRIYPYPCKQGLSLRFMYRYTIKMKGVFFDVPLF